MRRDLEKEDSYIIGSNEVKKNYEKYSQLISNNPEIGEEDIKHMGDFKGVDLENIGIPKTPKGVYFTRAP